MNPTAIACISFACVFGGALLGMFGRDALPGHHLSADSKDVVKLGVGLIGTMAALVIGLLIASAKGSFDTVNDQLKQLATKVILLDRALARYGPETADSRELLRRSVALKVDQVWPREGAQPAQVDILAKAAGPADEIAERQIRALVPQTDTQRALQSEALGIVTDVAQTRWMLFGEVGERSIPVPFLVVLVLWLVVIFASFGLFAPRNATVVAVLVLCALSASGAIFLILEMDRPFEGLMKVSDVPLRYALSQLGR
ncbi:MAG: hypothetical protein H6Q33_263 [Deltaproteobacteria bacterium]|jgi:hypothetical protein|nr:hypothetical protein [Deltaproteobacteria bacterium]